MNPLDRDAREWKLGEGRNLGEPGLKYGTYVPPAEARAGDGSRVCTENAAAVSCGGETKDGGDSCQ